MLDLGDTVGKMKKNFGVDKVLAWHAMSGYWAGVEPTAEGMAPFQPRPTHLIAPEGIQEVDPKVHACFHIFFVHIRTFALQLLNSTFGGSLDGQHHFAALSCTFGCVPLSCCFFVVLLIDGQMQPELDQKRFGMIPANRVESFYLSYHKYLKDNGVDGVKVKGPGFPRA